MNSDLAFSIIKIVLILIVGAGFVAGFYWFFVTVPEVPKEYVELKTTLQQYQSTADIYRGRTATFDGVCSSLVLPEEFNCHDNKDAYALEKRLSDGTYLCVDSNENFTERLYSKGEERACP